MRRSFAVFSVAAALVAATACGSSDSPSEPADEGTSTNGDPGTIEFVETPDLTKLLP